MVREPEHFRLLSILSEHCIGTLNQCSEHDEQFFEILRRKIRILLKSEPFSYTIVAVGKTAG